MSEADVAQLLESRNAWKRSAQSVTAQNAALIEALERIRTRTFGRVCDGYDLCEHHACHASYEAWAAADAALSQTKGKQE